MYQDILSFEKQREDEWFYLKYDEVSKAAKKGDGGAKTKMAWLMLAGRGGAKVDESKAISILEDRVDKNDSNAMWILGLCYEFGRGVQADSERAESLYKQSQGNGNRIGKFIASRQWYNEVNNLVVMRRL